MPLAACCQDLLSLSGHIPHSLPSVRSLRLRGPCKFEYLIPSFRRPSRAFFGLGGLFSDPDSRGLTFPLNGACAFSRACSPRPLDGAPLLLGAQEVPSHTGLPRSPPLSLGAKECLWLQPVASFPPSSWYSATAAWLAGRVKRMQGAGLTGLVLCRGSLVCGGRAGCVCVRASSIAQFCQ